MAVNLSTTPLQPVGSAPGPAATGDVPRYTTTVAATLASGSAIINASLLSPEPISADLVGLTARNTTQVLPTGWPVPVPTPALALLSCIGDSCCCRLCCCCCCGCCCCCCMNAHDKWGVACHKLHRLGSIFPGPSLRPTRTLFNKSRVHPVARPIMRGPPNAGPGPNHIPPCQVLVSMRDGLARVELQGLALTFPYTLEVAGSPLKVSLEVVLSGTLVLETAVGCPTDCGPRGRCWVGGNATALPPGDTATAAVEPAAACECECGWTGEHGAGEEGPHIWSAFAFALAHLLQHCMAQRQPWEPKLAPPCPGTLNCTVPLAAGPGCAVPSGFCPQFPLDAISAASCPAAPAPTSPPTGASPAPEQQCPACITAEGEAAERGAGTPYTRLLRARRG